MNDSKLQQPHQPRSSLQNAAPTPVRHIEAAAARIEGAAAAVAQAVAVTDIDAAQRADALLRDALDELAHTLDDMKLQQLRLSEAPHQNGVPIHDNASPIIERLAAVLRDHENQIAALIAARVAVASELERARYGRRGAAHYQQTSAVQR